MSILQCIGAKDGERFFDLGSGTGKISAPRSLCGIMHDDFFSYVFFSPKLPCQCYTCCCVCRSILFQVLAALHGLNSTGIELAPSRWKTSCRALQKMDSLGIRQESRTENSKVFVNCLPSGCFPYIHLKVVDLSWILGRIPIEPKLVADLCKNLAPPQLKPKLAIIWMIIPRAGWSC